MIYESCLKIQDFIEGKQTENSNKIHISNFIKYYEKI